MSVSRNRIPNPKDASGLNEIRNMIVSRFPDAVVGWRPSSDERGAWTLLVYLENEDEKYEALAKLVYGRLTELRYDEGVKIEMLPFDKAYRAALDRYLRSEYDWRNVTEAQIIDPIVAARVRRKRDDVAEVLQSSREDLVSARRQHKKKAKEPASSVK